MKSNKWMTGILASCAMALTAPSAHAFDGTYLLVQALIAVDAIDAVSLNKKLYTTEQLLRAQIDATNAFWKLGKQARTMEKEAELRARLQEIVATAATRVREEKNDTLKNGGYWEKQIALPKISEMEADLKQIRTWINNGAYYTAQQKAIALRADVLTAQANLK